MFIQTQDRKTIINTFAVKKFVITEENQIQAIIELPTKTKAAVVEVLAEYDCLEKAKAVVKGLMFEMRRREQAFKMPKNHKVNLMPRVKRPPTDPNAPKAEGAEGAPEAAAAEAPAAEAPAAEAPAAEVPAKE